MILWDIGRLAAGLKCGLVTACEELTIHEHMNFFTDFSSLEHVHAMGVADGVTFFRSLSLLDFWTVSIQFRGHQLMFGKCI